MNEYLSLVSIILPEGMLDWFNLKEVRTTTTDGQTTIHIYLNENEKTTYERRDLRPNGFTRESSSMGEVYTIISNKDAHSKKKCITGSPCCLEA